MTNSSVSLENLRRELAGGAEEEVEEATAEEEEGISGRRGRPARWNRDTFKSLFARCQSVVITTVNGKKRGPSSFVVWPAPVVPER